MEELNLELPAARSLPVPDGPAVTITDALICQAVEASRRSPRGRIVLPLSAGHSEPLQRMLNALQPGSYVQPHRHVTPPKAESVVVLRGSLACWIFDELGTIVQSVTLTPAFQEGGVGIDIRPGIYHGFCALQPDTVVFEVKSGPYDERSDKQFAPWAPVEGSPDAAPFLARLTEMIKAG